MRVLVAEDSTINQNVIRKMLFRLGHEADFANNGQQALSLLKSSAYDLVFMDCEMPDIDGFTVVENYRAYAAQANLQHTPIIALTAHTLPEHREKANLAGMDDYLTKPLRLEVLKQVLTQWTKKPDNLQVPNNNKTVEISTTLNLHKLESLLGKEEAHIILAAFADYAVGQFDELKALYKKNELESLYRKAHQFKGESIQVGAIGLSELCKQLEMTGREDKPMDITAQLARIEAELTQVLNALQNITNQND